MSMSRMNVPPLAVALAMALPLAGCADPVSTDASLVMTVVVDEVAYHPAAALDIAEAVGSRHAEVARYVDCSQGVWLESGAHVSDYCPLRDGESNYLPAGTPIHRVVGREPAEALTVQYDGRWELLRPSHGEENGA